MRPWVNSGPAEPKIAPSSLEEGVGGGESNPDTTGRTPTRKVMLERAAAMRNNPTEPEKRLWYALRDSRFFGTKFRRQAIIGFRIVDLFCPAKALAIEIDGDTHDTARDLRRDAKMKHEFGYDVLRFTNAEVMQNLEGVLTALQIRLDETEDRWVGRASATVARDNSADTIDTTPLPPPLKRRGSVAEAVRAAAALLGPGTDTARL